MFNRRVLLGSAACITGASLFPLIARPSVSNKELLLSLCAKNGWCVTLECEWFDCIQSCMSVISVNLDDRSSLSCIESYREVTGSLPDVVEEQCGCILDILRDTVPSRVQA